MKKTPAAPCADDNGSLLDLVLSALHAKGWYPDAAPEVPLPFYMNRDNLDALYIDEHAGGFVGNIGFRNVPPGAPNTIGSPDAHPFADPTDAFFAAARTVCLMVNGSPELPFCQLGDKLVCTVY